MQAFFYYVTGFLDAVFATFDVTNWPSIYTAIFPAVAVASGSIAYEGTDYALSANGSYSLSSAPSSGNRFDLVVARYATSAVTIQTVTGTASSTNPVFPALPAADIVLAAVLRRANESIVANDIIDKRAFCLASPSSTITLGTNTTGDYVASLVAGTSITLTNNSGETATPTIAVSNVALGSNTTGDYVASLVAGSSITLTNNSGEGATPTIALNVDFGDNDQIVLGTQVFG